MSAKPVGWRTVITRASAKPIVALGAVLAFVAAVASWAIYFGPDQMPQRWVVVSAGWGRCGTAVQQGVTLSFCEVRGTFRNDGGTAPDRYLPSSTGAFGDVYAYTALFMRTPTDTCGVLLSAKTHHGQSVTVSCAVIGLVHATLPPTAIDTRIPIKVEIRREDHFRSSTP
jgi:hypothetical protein